MSIDNGIADALLPTRELPNDWYIYNSEKQSLTGENNGFIFNIGMKFKVKIIEVVPTTGSILVKWSDGISKRQIYRHKKKRQY